MTILISIDPGKNKCGLLLADTETKLVLDGKVVHKKYVSEIIESWQKSMPVKEIIMGNGTTSIYWSNLLRKILPIRLVEEYGTTLLARKRYWELWPPSIFLRFIPKGLMLPDEPLDAVAALILLENYLKITFNWPEKCDFKILP